jgi:glycerate 2-kinase
VEFSRFFTHSLRDVRVAHILAAALQAVDPGRAVRAYLQEHPLSEDQRTYALAVGKAAISMMEGLTRTIDIERALVITKQVLEPDANRLHKRSPDIRLIEGGHPLPDERSLAAGEAALAFASALEPDDLLVCLISGGGSALMSVPLAPLKELQVLTSALLACGAPIDAINTLRRHLDRVKGGGLAKATRAQVLSLILSDVVYSPLEAIASGPTAPDPTTREQALGVLEKYGLSSANLHTSPLNDNKGGSHTRRFAYNLPSTILQSLSSIPETPKPGDPLFSRVQNVIVGDNALAVETALKQAREEGFQVESLGSAWQGEAREVGPALVDRLRVATNQIKAPFCLAAGGETTVTIQGAGKGGRNQELALAAVPTIADLEGAMLISLASDGEDGPTDAAGAVVTSESLRRAKALGLDPGDYLARNDAYTFFDRLGDLLKTGPTGTNVNDLVFLFRL